MPDNQPQLYAVLIRFLDMSPTDASSLFEVSEDLAAAWATASVPVPTNIEERLLDLLATLVDHAAEVVNAVKGYDSPIGVEFGIPSSTEEAQELGFPSIGCFEAMGAFVALALRAERIGVNFARRGSTTGSQQAIYARYLAEGDLRDEE
ncbi:MAG: hypothetical protein M0Z92_13770 [Actinomycetota bacterium]|nr:hypothetical protein [Actinomycetota bacterium]